MYLIDRDRNYMKVEVVEGVNPLRRPDYLWRWVRSRTNELWQFRELVQNLVIRDLKVRYKNSLLGVVWSLLNPLLMMIVFTAVFTVMRGEAVGDFPVFVLTGLLPWQFFTNSASTSTASIVGNAHLINKVYFPREVLIISGVLSNLVNFLIALLVLVPILILFKIQFTFWLILLPVMIFIQLIFTLGVGFIVGTVNVFYRDVQMIMEVVLLAGFFLTPVFYSLDILPHSYVLFGVDLDVWKLTYYLNPMASIIANYRIILLSGAPPALDFLARTLITSLGFLFIGLLVFYRFHTRFSEEL